MKVMMMMMMKEGEESPAARSCSWLSHPSSSREKARPRISHSVVKPWPLIGSSELKLKWEHGLQVRGNVEALNVNVEVRGRRTTPRPRAHSLTTWPRLHPPSPLAPRPSTWPYLFTSQISSRVTRAKGHNYPTESTLSSLPTRSSDPLRPLLYITSNRPLLGSFVSSKP